MEKEQLNKNFREEVKDLDIGEYNEFDNRLRKHILENNFKLEDFESENDFKEYVEKWIHMFKEKILGCILGEELNLNYNEKLSEEFHKKYLEIVVDGKAKDFYEETVKSF